MTETMTDTRMVIIRAALKCFRTHGPDKTTVVDIVRESGVSRTTVYEYFADKAAITAATVEYTSELFYREMALAMGRGHTLEDGLSHAAVVVIRARQLVEPEKYFDADAVNVLLTRNAATLLTECSDFLAPYITAAKLTGEVRRDLDVEFAGEWFARILFSLFTIPSSRMNFNDAALVRAFVGAHVVQGFNGLPSGSRRSVKSASNT